MCPRFGYLYKCRAQTMLNREDLIRYQIKYHINAIAEEQAKEQRRDAKMQFKQWKKKTMRRKGGFGKLGFG
jgi:hypothetical protein